MVTGYSHGNETDGWGVGVVTKFKIAIDSAAKLHWQAAQGYSVKWRLCFVSNSAYKEGNSQFNIPFKLVSFLSVLLSQECGRSFELASLRLMSSS